MKQESIAVLRIETRWRMRQRWHRAEKSLILQGKAICRAHTEGDKDAADALFKRAVCGDDAIDLNITIALMPFLSAISNFKKLRKSLEKELAILARDLPAATFIDATPGIALPSLAAIVGEAGDLSNYSTHSKLWRRMGMAPFVKDGVARSGLQWKIAGGLNAEDWSEFGYSGVRRSVMFVIEESMMKAKGPYREIYIARKEYLRHRAESNGLTVAPAAKIPAKRRDEFVSLGHIDQDSKRYMGKRLLRDLWKAWRRAANAVAEKPTHPLSDDKIADAAQAAGQARLMSPSRAEVRMPDHQLPDALQGAGEAIGFMPTTARNTLPRQLDAAQAAGEATDAVPNMAALGMPPHQSRDAA